MKTHLTRRTIPAEFKDTSTWRAVDPELIEDDAERQRFLAMQAAVQSYLAGDEKISVIAKRNALHEKQVLRSVNRCITRAEDGRLFGWAGLIRHQRVKPFVRSRPLPAVAVDGKGFAGAFQLLLARHPALLARLQAQVLKLKRAMTPFEINQAITRLHSQFLGWCTDEGIPAGQYPFSTASAGKRSLARLVMSLREQHFSKGLRAQGFKDAAHRLKVGTGYPATLLAMAPFDVVQMDEHRLHMVGTVLVPTASGFTPVPIQRMSLVLLVDVFSQAVLGYALIVKREANQIDMVAAINAAINVWEPREFSIPGLAYAPGAGLPSGLIVALRGAAWAMLQVDNALVHYANVLIERVRHRLGFAINFGPFGSWERRPIVESLFARLEEMGFQRIVSSTGTGPQDETIENPNAAAVRFKVENRHLIDLVDLVIANFNARPIPAMGMKSPLDVLRDFAAQQESLFLARTLPPAVGWMADLSIQVERHVIRGSRRQGRRPYIQIDTQHYTNPFLADAVDLIGTELVVHIDPRDMRSVRAFFPNGQELGDLMVTGRWGISAWSREEGRQIRSLIDAGTLQLDAGADPVECFHRYLAMQAQEAARAQKAKQPKTNAAATQIAAIQAEGRDTPALNTLVTVPLNPPPLRTGGLPLGKFDSLRTDQAGRKGGDQ
jgi:putative transposase